MLKNYFKTAFRVIWKNKVFSAVNIIGLAISMACCLAIAFYVWNERSYDTFHTNAASLYRITAKQNQAGKLYNVAVTPGPLADALRKDFPEIKNSVRIGNWSGLLKHNNQVYEEKNVQLIENSFFSMFNFKMMLGNAKTALQSPDEIVLTEKEAQRIFGAKWKSNPSLLGEVFTLNGQDNFKLAGVVENPPQNSSIQFDVLLPVAFLFKTDEWSYKWQSSNYHTYLQLKPGTDVQLFESKLAKQLKVYKPETEDILQLQPLSKQYLYSKFDFFTDWGKRSDVKYVNIFTAVGLLLLLIACVNFINLSTARSVKRSMEVGVRKVTGASRRQLILQFLSESLLITVFASVLAVLILKAAQPLLETLAGNEALFSVPGNLFALFFAAFIIVIGFVAGIYPAFILSAFKPVKSLKGAGKEKSSAFFRKGLVVFQFAISVTLMICTLFMYRQLTFMQKKNLGFNSEQVLRIRLGGALRGKLASFKNDLETQSSIVATAPATMTLANVDNSGNYEWEGMQQGEEFLMTQSNVDTGFINTLGLTLLRGNNFAYQTETDSINQYVINETAVKMMGRTLDNVLGTKVKFWGAPGTITGVVKDFHFKPLSAGIEPFLFRYQPFASYFHLFVKTAPGKTADAIKTIQKYYKQYDAELPLEFTFLNESINQLYQKEKQTASVILLFACLTIFVGCLGLFGLSVFAAEQRVKEIGIRKVLGAGIASVTQLLSKDFMKLVVAGFVIAVPVAWFIASRWLQNFAYRIELNWWVFVLAGFIIAAIAFITISYQSIKAALANPAKSLRTE
jgi:putative ABC transport system permease protein